MSDFTLSCRESGEEDKTDLELRSATEKYTIGGHAGSGMGWPPGKLLKLTDDDIRAIFRLKSSMSQKMLAARFRVTTSLIHKLLHGGYSDVAYERCGIDASQINSTQYRDRRKQIA